MKKILSLLSSFSIVLAAPIAVVSCGFNMGDVTLKNHLVHHVSKTNLGFIESEDEEIIKLKIKELNSDLKMESIAITNIKNRIAVISGTEDGIYSGQLQIKFNLKGDQVRLEDRVLVGYYFDWNGEGQTIPTFEELVKTNYNVINVSFLYSKKNFEMPKYSPQNPEGVKAGIKLLQSKGKKVLISMGGAPSSEMKFRANQKNELKQTILDIVDEYGFDGLDINWAQKALTDSRSQQTTVDALKEIKDENPEFIITMAPEMPYLTNKSENSDKGSYITFLKGLEDYYNWVNPQLYNGRGFGPYIESQEKKKLKIKEDYIANDNEKYRAEFYYLMTKYLTTVYSKQNDYYLIDPDKFVLGAAANEIAASGAASKDSIKRSYRLLKKDKIYTKGLMSWAINYDAFEGTVNVDGQQIYNKKWSFESWYNQTYNK
ncbi:glycosyl hydrolase family 18 protein [Spiroplasma cantharicola]|uniref:Chitinase n=1 Tax=Spiroplasma cantharicola TaxID=362837 RepID=A0A0M3SJ87_9MOLU|nr:glycosyl hydrolase family 18 protein [Spiroplasma cantharicola]ALD66304.1 chitinase [Spiroplasma cantharicola]